MRWNPLRQAIRPLQSRPRHPIENTQHSQPNDFKGLAHRKPRCQKYSFSIIPQKPVRSRTSFRTADRRRVPQTSRGFDVTTLIVDWLLRRLAGRIDELTRNSSDAAAPNTYL